jgi:hypothetical protein
MAKKGLDYFSFDVGFFDNDKVALIEAEFGMKGVFILLKLLCKIYSEGYYCEWGEDQCLLFTSRKLKPSIPDLTAKVTQQVVESLVKRGFFNKDLYEKHGILTSKNIQERYYEVAKRRQKTEFNNEFWLLGNNNNVDKNAENVDKNAENVDIFSQSKVKESKGKESKYNNLPQDAHTRGGEVKNLYFELGKWAQIREDLWEAVAISGSFQNNFTQYYREWLQLDEGAKRNYPLNELNQALRKQCGEINIEWYNAICWCKDNLSDIDYREIYSIAGSKPQALTELRFAIKEVGKGKITQPGAFILSRLRKV